VADERGIALVSVVLMMAILFVFAATIFARSLSDYNQVRSDRLFQQTLQVADSGVDHTLFMLTKDLNHNTGEILPASFANKAAEEAWVLGEAADNPSVIVPEGEWAVVKPQTEKVIYSVGYVRDRTDPIKIRIVRAEYDFAPFQPGVAILTDGDLVISGNPSLEGSQGSAHANGDVVVNGNPSTTGYVSASGDYEVTGDPSIGDTENSGGGRPPREVPMMDPREAYVYSEYDLCPDGLVRTGPAYTSGPEPPNPGLTPCTGTVLADADGTDYRNWKMTGNDASQGAKWDYSGNQTYDGVYYLYHGSAKVSGNPGDPGAPWNVTILAEAQYTGAEPNHCPHTGGDIELSGNPKTRAHTKAYPLLFIAGRDLQISGNPGAGEMNYEGFMGAHEQFKVSGNPSVFGSIVANDNCDTPGSPVNVSEVEVSGNPNITYNGAEIPLGRIIRITHWLEI
jgi:hypothetical protein